MYKTGHFKPSNTVVIWHLPVMHFMLVCLVFSQNISFNRFFEISNRFRA